MFTYTYINTNTYIGTSVFVYTYVYTSIPTYILVHIHIYTQKYTNIYLYIHTYIVNTYAFVTAVSERSPPTVVVAAVVQ